MSNQLDKVKKEITRLEVGIKSSERDLKKSKDKYEAFDAEVAELENKIREGKTERDDLVKQNETLEAQVAELKVNRVFFLLNTGHLCQNVQKAFLEQLSWSLNLGSSFDEYSIY